MFYDFYDDTPLSQQLPGLLPGLLCDGVEVEEDKTEEDDEECGDSHEKVQSQWN